MPGIPNFKIDLSHLDPRRRRDRWQELLSTHEIESIEDRAAGLPSEITGWLVDHIALGPASTGFIRLRRTPTHIRRDQIDHYAFGISLGGSWNGDACGENLSVAGDAVFVMDMARPMVAEASHMNTIQLVVPRDLLDAVVPPRDLHGLTLQGGAAGLLHDHIRSLVRRLPALTQADAPAVVKATVAMIAAAVRPTADNLAIASPVVESVLLARVRRHIEGHLGNPELGSDTICAALRLSRSRLYQLFERFGGVSAYIQDRRLTRIHAVLVGGQDNRLLFAIAQSFGFTDPSHFSRAFRAAYGISARDFRRQGPSDTPRTSRMAAASDDALVTWLRAL